MQTETYWLQQQAHEFRFKKILSCKKTLYLGRIPEEIANHDYVVIPIFIMFLVITATLGLSEKVFKDETLFKYLPFLVCISLTCTCYCYVRITRWTSKKLRRLRHEQELSNGTHGTFTDTKKEKLESLTAIKNSGHFIPCIVALSLILTCIDIIVLRWGPEYSAIGNVLIVWVLEPVIRRLFCAAVLHLDRMQGLQADNDVIMREWGAFGDYIYDRGDTLLSLQRVVELYPKYLEHKKYLEQKKAAAVESEPSDSPTDTPKMDAVPTVKCSTD